MTRARKTLAIIGIAILVAAALIPIAAHDVMLVVSWLVVPVTILLLPLRVRHEPLRQTAACGTPVLLRAPPSVSSTD